MSREIDAMVAERVMGWTLSGRTGYGWPIPCETVPAMKFPEYSTDISAAWRVVEKMRAEHAISFAMRLTCGLSSVPSMVAFRFGVYAPWDGPADSVCYAASVGVDPLPLAICKAALAAIAATSEVRP